MRATNPQRIISLIILSLVGVLNLLAQKEGTIKGVVIDSETRQAIPMVNIYVQGTNRGTASDERGAFQINIPAGKMQVLAVSHIGYKKEAYDAQIEVGQEMDVTIELEPQAVRMAEVTVTERVPFEETTAYRVITEKEIESIRSDDLRDVMRWHVPQVLSSSSWLTALRGQANFTLYVDNIRWDPRFLDAIIPYTVKKIYVWRRLWAPIYFQIPSGSSYVVHVITK